MTWWQQIYQYGLQLLNLTQKVDRHDSDIEKMRRQLDELADAVKRLAFEVKLDRETEAKDRRMLLLEVQNELLRFERRLPPPGSRPDE